MWDGDFGCVPVVGDDGRVVGIITDRDICMAAYFSGRALGAIKVADAMAKTVYACDPDAPVHVAESLMQTHQIRRLPVVDGEERLVGVLSLNDIAAGWSRECTTNTHDLAAHEVAETLAAVCAARPHALAAAA
jgi:CBS domain-containing protein